MTSSVPSGFFLHHLDDLFLRNNAQIVGIDDLVQNHQVILAGEEFLAHLVEGFLESLLIKFLLLRSQVKHEGDRSLVGDIFHPRQRADHIDLAAGRFL